MGRVRFVMACGRMPHPCPKTKSATACSLKLSGGRIVEATIKAIVDTTEGIRLQVDVGYDETALIYDWQVVEEGH
jgi:hypothetical protein